MLTKFQHDKYGECELVRIESVDWIVRSCGSGQQYRVPPSRRHDFVPIDGSRPVSSESANLSTDPGSRRETPSVANNDGVNQMLRGLRNREADLAGLVERANQLGRALRKGVRPGETLLPDSSNISAPTPSQPQVSEAQSARALEIGVPVRPEAHFSASRSVNLPVPVESPRIRVPVVVEPSSVTVTDGIDKAERRRLRRVFESLRNGLSPIHVDSRPFAVGIDAVQRKVDNLLSDVAAEGGRAVVIRGAYGQGKTFCLQLMKQIALESGYVVASTEIDAFENQIDKPHFIYRSLMQSLSFPDGGLAGPQGLALRTRSKLFPQLDAGHGEYLIAMEARRLLDKVVQCRPLAWLLSGLALKDKPELIGLLGCEPGVSVSNARKAHVLGGIPRDWPAFSAGTQGDFGSYVLSGIGRLSRFLGYRGFILILDEMEKWQDLDWNAQCRAGNLLGGLIWGASADKGNRQCRNLSFQPWCAHTRSLTHSGRCGGYPFSTEDRCYLGVAIAMTPRGDTGPEYEWSNYGLLEYADLPDFTPMLLETYIQKVFPSYCRAYEIQTVMPQEMMVKSVNRWRDCGDGSTRTAVQSVMATLDEWRESFLPREV
jgi:hypothetical protein